MAAIRAHVFSRLTRRALAAGCSWSSCSLALAPAASAARSGRVAPENRWSPWAPGKTADAVLRDV